MYRRLNKARKGTRATAVAIEAIERRVLLSASFADGPAMDSEPTPVLSADFGRVTLPDVFVPGDRATAQVVITNNATTAVRGRVNVTLYASLDGTLDAGDFPIDTGTTLANKALVARAGGKATFTGRFVAPSALANGTYVLLAKVTPAGIEGATETTAATSTPYVATTSFGQVGTRRNVRYTFADSDGSLVTFSLSGPGTGVLSTDGDELNVTINGTTAASRFNAIARGGNSGEPNEVYVANFTINGPMAAVNGKAVEVTGSFTVGDVRTVTLQDVHGIHGNEDDVAVTFNGTTPIALTLADVRDAHITSNAPIRSLRALAWTDAGFNADFIAAPYIGSITVAGRFEPSVTLSGNSAPRGISLASMRVGTDVDDKVWSVQGDVGALTIGGSVPTGWVGNISGSLRSLTVKGNFAGNLGAANIGSFAVTGNVTTASVRAGWNYGPDNAPNTVDDTAAVGVINRLSVRGSVIGSQFWAGADTSGAPLTGGMIRSIAIRSADPNTRFVAATVPRAVRIDGITIITATDPRFVTEAI